MQTLLHTLVNFVRQNLETQNAISIIAAHCSTHSTAYRALPSEENFDKLVISSPSFSFAALSRGGKDVADTRIWTVTDGKFLLCLWA